MTPTELQKILQSDEKLSLSKIKEIIWQLKTDCFGKIYELKDKQNTAVKTNEWIVDDINNTLNPYLAERFYQGETNAFYICLDLLEKVGE